MAKSLLAFSAALPLCTAGTVAVNPLGQVLSLMDELTAKIKREGGEEQASFEKYQAWCEKVTGENQRAIDTSFADKEKLEARIEDLVANIEVGQSKIADLAAAISKAEEELGGANRIREKESSEFVAAKAELVDTVDTLARAIKVIQGKGASAFAQVDGRNFVQVVHSLSTVVDALGLNMEDQNRLTALVQSQQDDDDADAPAASVYESKSGGIVDTLEDLKEKADAELVELRRKEEQAQHNYNMLKQSFEDQLAADNKNMAEEKDLKAKAEQDKATADSDLGVTADALAKAKEELSTAGRYCMQAAADHEKTVADRVEELKVVEKAKQIVVESTSEASSFLQLSAASQIRSRVDLVHSEVFAIVKKLAKKGHSAALAQLASQITAVMRYSRSTGGDPFSKVRGLITDMIAKLEKESAEAADEKKYCDAETAKTVEKKDDLGSAVEKLTSSIAQKSARSVALKEDVKELEGELAALAKEQAEMDAMRQENHAVNMKAIQELNTGLGGVRKALGVLRDYYASADGSASFVQEQNGKAGGAGQSIINMLEVVESDIAKNLADTETEEELRATAYADNTQENKLSKAAKEKDVEYKAKEAVALDKDVSDLSSDLEDENSELSAVNDYWDKLKERCVAKPESYEERKERREAEIAGLKEALGILENEAAFLQKTKAHHRRNMRGSLSVD